MKPSLKRLDWFNIALISLATLVAAMGFFYPDPYYYRGDGSGGLRLLLWGLRGGTVLTGAGIIWLYYSVRTQRVELSLLLLALGGITVGALFLYPLIVYVYYDRTAGRIPESYHPYLQIAPQSFAPRDPEAFQVVCLGGSTTAWANSNGSSWPAIVERELGQRLPSLSLEVHNAGREWYTSLHSLINYSTNVHHHRPEVIVVMHALNDLLHNADFSYYSSGPFREDYGHFLGPLGRMLNKRSFWGNLAEKLGGAWYHTPREEISTGTFPGVGSLKRHLNALIDLASAHGTKVILMTEPHLYKERMTLDEVDSLYMLHKEAIGPDSQWSLATARTGMERYNDAIREVASFRNVGLIDLDKVVPKTLQYFTDDVHYTDEAYPVIGLHVAEHLASSGVIPAPQKR